MSDLKKTVFAFTFVVICWMPDAEAQSSGRHQAKSGKSYSKSVRFSQHRYPVYAGYRSYGHYSHHGFANLVRSQAQSNLVNAQAATQNEITRSARLDNDIKQLQNYRQRRAMNSEVRFSHLWERGAQVRLEKATTADASLLVGLNPVDENRMDAGQLHPVTGQLSWPLLLQSERFCRARGPVDQIFSTRAQTGQINPEHYLPLLDWIKKIDGELDTNVHDYPAASYADAKDFLRRVVVEASVPATQVGMHFATN